MTSQENPGWYHGEGDPEGTLRYWDGNVWATQPMVPAAPPIELTMAKEATQVHGRRIADTARRVVASLLDSIAGIAFSIPVIISALRSVDWSSVGNGTQPKFHFSIGGVAFGSLLSALYFIGSVAIWGATPGKRVMKLVIVRGSDGRKPDLLTAILRHSPYLAFAVLALATINRNPQISNLGTLLGIANLILVVTDERRRSLGDRIAKTFVVERENPPT